MRQLPQAANSCATSPATRGTAARWSGRPRRRRRRTTSPSRRVVHDTDAWWDMKQRGCHASAGGLPADPHAEEHRRPAWCCRLLSAACCGFAHDLAHVVAGRRLAGGRGGLTRSVHTFNYNRDYYIPARGSRRKPSTRARGCWRRPCLMPIAIDPLDGTARPSSVLDAQGRPPPGERHRCWASGST